jgi:GT2 family glycosyltransferase
MSEAWRVAVVIPNYNGRSFILNCLEAVQGQTVRAAEVVVVDNGSTDGSDRLIEESFPDVVLVRHDRNAGFGAAANLGFRRTRSPWVAVLNSDATPAPDWLALLEPHAVEDVWAIGGVLVTPEGRVESAGDAYDVGGFAYKLLRGQDLGALPAHPYDVFAPPGAAPVYRRSVFESIGGFHEPFFLYYEDVDLAWRGRLAGWRAVVVPTAHVSHLGQGSGIAARSWRCIGRNSAWCAVRDHPFVTPAAIWRRTRREARTARQRGMLWPYLRGRLDFVGRLPVALAQRRKIQRTRVVDDAAVRAFLGTPAELAGLHR